MYGNVLYAHIQYILLNLFLGILFLRYKIVRVSFNLISQLFVASIKKIQ